MMIYFKLNNEVTFRSPIRNIQIDAIKLVKIRNVGGKWEKKGTKYFPFFPWFT